MVIIDGKVYNKPGKETLMVYDSYEILRRPVWYSYYIMEDGTYKFTHIEYDDETIFFALRKDWSDNQ